jgi:hypothetical protein
VIRKLLPSPAMVVALTALFLTLGGSAYALVITGKSIRNGTVTGGDIRNGSLASRDVKRDGLGGRSINESRLGVVPQAEGLSHHAVVTAQGILTRGRGVSSAARTAVGRYQVIFNRDIRGCAYVASLGAGSAEAPPEGQATTGGVSTNVNAVAIRTESSNGTLVDRPFHLIVSC